MGQEVKVWSFSDKTLADRGEKVEADHTHVPLQFGKLSGELDLTSAEHSELALLLGPWLAAMQKKKATKKRGRPSQAYFDGLKAFIEQETGEELQHNSGGKFDYPKDLRRKYDEKMGAR